MLGSEVAFPEILHYFVYLAGNLAAAGVFCSLSNDYSCGDGGGQRGTEGDGLVRDILTRPLGRKLKLNLTCLGLAHTDAVRVAFSVGRGLQVQRVDVGHVQLVPDQPAPRPADVDAVLGEAGPVFAGQLLDLIGLTGGEESTGELQIPTSLKLHMRSHRRARGAEPREKPGEVLEEVLETFEGRKWRRNGAARRKECGGDKLGHRGDLQRPDHFLEAAANQRTGLQGAHVTHTLLSCCVCLSILVWTNL